MSPSDLLNKLESSELFAPDFPKRIRYTHAEAATSRAQEMQPSAHAAAIAAIERVKNWRELVDLVRELGQAQHEAAVPVLRALWNDCALVPVRTATGHALRAIGSDDARLALESSIEDHDSLSVFLGVHAIFDRDPSAAFDRLAPYFETERRHAPGGTVIPRQILGAFRPWSFTYKNGVEVPEWPAPWAQTLLVTDRRWLDLCIRLRHDAMLGDVARTALRHADRATVDAALAAALRTEPSRVLAPTTAPVGDLVTRYTRGEYDEVWRQLRALGAIAGDLREEALAVARETMRRVARAADVVAERLADQGWASLSGSLRTPPAAEHRAIVERIAIVTGQPLPVSVQAFWEIVGGIDFVWDYASDEVSPDFGLDLDMTELDPLAVDPITDAEPRLADWHEESEGVHPELVDPCELSLAPDYLHKANISGGPPYGIELPFRGADPIFINEAHQLPFVDYLRLCFRWACFPGLERHADRADVRAFVARMTDGIEPF